MFSHRDNHIHSLSFQQISSILEKGAWTVEDQTITSAITNDNDLSEPDFQLMETGENTAGINAFFDIQFDSNVKRILDVGGGKFDNNCDYMRNERNIELLIWDPYNRTPSHNTQIKAEITKNNADAVTSMSVLNVIPESSVRLAHIITLKTALKLGGKAYFKIWPGDLALKGSYLPSATQSSYQANAYADRFISEIEMVFGVGNVKLDSNVPNLIIATKLTETSASLHNIKFLCKKSENEEILLTRIRENSIKKIYARTNIIKLFSFNLMFFKKMENMFLNKNQNTTLRIQNTLSQSHLKM